MFGIKTFIALGEDNVFGPNTCNQSGKQTVFGKSNPVEKFVIIKTHLEIPNTFYSEHISVDASLLYIALNDFIGFHPSYM